MRECGGKDAREAGGGRGGGGYGVVAGRRRHRSTGEVSTSPWNSLKEDKRSQTKRREEECSAIETRMEAWLEQKSNQTNKGEKQWDTRKEWKQGTIITNLKACCALKTLTKTSQPRAAVVTDKDKLLTRQCWSLEEVDKALHSPTHLRTEPRRIQTKSQTASTERQGHSASNKGEGKWNYTEPESKQITWNGQQCLRTAESQGWRDSKGLNSIQPENLQTDQMLDSSVAIIRDIFILFCRLHTFQPSERAATSTSKTQRTNWSPVSPYSALQPAERSSKLCWTTPVECLHYPER